MTEVVAAPDSCRIVTEYAYKHKVLEGTVCNDKREGLWKEWTTDGRLKDSARYTNGVRTYTDAAVKHAKGTVLFKGNPRQFYKDSTYECCVRVDIYHGPRDIRGDYEGVADTVYPPLFYFGADMGARDSFSYYFTPKSAGKYRLKISLTGDAASIAGNSPFYVREIEVVRR